MFAQAWFLGLFCYPLIPLPVTSRIWDAFLVDGFSSLHRAGLAALQMRQDELLAASNEETLLPLLTQPLLRYDPQVLMERAATLVITDKTLLYHMSVCDPNSSTPTAESSSISS
jgi:hypothetical protein